MGNLPLEQSILLYVLSVWSLIWKGLALWRSAKQGQKNWFIAIVILNSLTVGVLEIIYLFRFSTKRMAIKEIKNFFGSVFSKKKPQNNP